MVTIPTSYAAVVTSNKMYLIYIKKIVLPSGGYNRKMIDYY